MDGVSGEVLYRSLAMDQYGIEDAAIQEASFRVYNDWLIEYCAYAPDRLFGVGMIATYDMQAAVAELQRCKHAGLRGAMIWQVPPDELSFASDHYDPFWEACQSLGMPVSLHILTGKPYPPGAVGGGGRRTAVPGIAHGREYQGFLRHERAQRHHLFRESSSDSRDCGWSWSRTR